MPVKNLAQEDVVTVERDTEVSEIARTMDDERVGSVVVVEDDEPVGIVTDRTIGLSVGQEDDPASQTAEDLMSEDPETVEADTEAYDLAVRFGEAKVRRLPVVDDGGKLAGIVSLDDLIATSAEQLEEAAKVIEAQSPGYSPDER
ncbi:CBS domain-containing protein [Halalkalicoccus sp. NIPERK01]|uniref:CBS domain-containing protein n=1 Tax=Halalkalicoccus sp. NIPERK01 TaxID=3053469 RepID=UPI00256ED049|nr:CBS domain-containing protein [Halalkalicoccus sp. NIPERK01]MDL5362082.1 CBS domain-containing protein [Halalkalicoccus sp. NIPERK01]